MSFKCGVNSIGLSEEGTARLLSEVLILFRLPLVPPGIWEVVGLRSNWEEADGSLLVLKGFVWPDAVGEPGKYPDAILFASSSSFLGEVVTNLGLLTLGS